MQDAGLSVVGKKNGNAAQLLQLKVLVSSALAGIQTALYSPSPQAAKVPLLWTLMRVRVP